MVTVTAQNTDKLAELAAAAREATPGPWHVGKVRTYGIFPIGDDIDGEPPSAVATVGHYESELRPYTQQGARDARYIALADPTTILALIEERDRLRVTLDEFGDPFAANSTAEAYAKGLAEGRTEREALANAVMLLPVEHLSGSGPLGPGRIAIVDRAAVIALLLAAHPTPPDSTALSYRGKEVCKLSYLCPHHTGHPIEEAGR